MTETDTPNTETHFKVRVPVERTIRLRDAERDMTLAEAVKTDRGQLLFPEETVLDGKRINKLRNFSVRTIRVEDTETKWVDEPTYQNLPAETDVLEEKQIPTDAESEEPESPNPESLRGAFNFLENTESPGRISDFVEELTQTLSEDDGLGEAVRELSGQTESLEDLFRYLLRQIGNLDDAEQRQELLNELYGLGKSSEESSDPPASDVPADLATKMNQLDDQKQELQTDILDFLHGNPDALKNLPEEQVPDPDLGDPESLPESPTPEDVDSELDDQLLEELLPRLVEWLRERSSPAEVEDTFEDIPDSGEGHPLRELVEKSDELGEETINELLQDLTGSSPAPGESLENVMNKLREGEWNESIEEFSSFLSDSSYQDPNASFSEFDDRATSLKSEQDTLRQTMEGQVEEDELLEVIREHLEFNGKDYSETLRETDISADTIDEADDFRDRRRSVVLEFWDHLRDHLPSLLQSLGEDEEEQLLESVRETTDRVARFDHENTSAAKLQAEESTTEGARPQRKERLAKARKQGDYETLKGHSRLPDEVIDQFRTSYRPPAETDKWQEQLINTFQEILEELVLVLRVSQESVESFLSTARDVLRKQNKPFSLFLQPPSADHYHLVHAYNTVLLNVMVAERRNLALLEHQKLLLSGALADVGLTVIPESLYLKEGDLTVRAANEMSKHPVYSRKIARYIFGEGHTVPKMVHQHHERIDGSGYPQGLSGEEIHFLARILTVSDAYTARIENRPYRSAQLPDEALTQMERNRDEYDGDVVDDVIGILGFYPNGSLVKLSNEKLAFVKEQHPESPTDPSVYVLTDKKRNRLTSPERLDLREREDLTVEILLRT